MFYLFTKFPVEIRCNILKYAGFTYATLFDDDYAANYTYDPSLDTLDCLYEQGNKKGIEWVLTHVNRKFWANNTVLVKAILANDYATVSFLNNVYLKKASSNVPAIVSNETDLSIKGESTFNHVPAFHLDSRSLHLLASKGLASVIINLSMEHLFVVDEVVIMHALNTQQFTAAQELVKAFNITITHNIVKTASVRVMNGQDMEFFARSKSHWNTALEGFIQRDAIKLVEYCFQNDHFHLTPDQFSDLLMTPIRKYRLLQAYNNAVSPKYEYFKNIGKYTPYFLSQYILPRLPTPSYSEYASLLKSICDAKNVSLFEYIVLKKYPNMYDHVVRRMLASDLIQFQRLVVLASKDLHMFQCFHRYTWYLLSRSTQNTMNGVCLGNIFAPQEVFEWLVKITDTSLLTEDSWFRLFTHHFLNNTESIHACQWIAKNFLAGSGWRKPSVMERMKNWFNECMGTNVPLRQQKALFLLDFVPEIINKNEGQANFAFMATVNRSLITKLMELCDIKNINLEVTNYAWLCECTVRDFMWVLERSHPDYIDWWTILDALKLYGNRKLFSWIKAQKTLELRCYNKSVEFCPKWK